MFNQREIKFRAWDKEKKEWVKYFSINPEGSVFTHEICEETGNERNPNIILLQFTGLKDCKGKEIYEGDIVKDLKDPKGIEKQQIIFKNGSFQYGTIFGVPLYKLNLKNFEIIGDIYENSESSKELK